LKSENISQGGGRKLTSHRQEIEKADDREKECRFVCYYYKRILLHRVYIRIDRHEDVFFQCLLHQFLEIYSPLGQDMDLLLPICIFLIGFEDLLNDIANLKRFDLDGAGMLD